MRFLALYDSTLRQDAGDFAKAGAWLASTTATDETTYRNR